MSNTAGTDTDIRGSFVNVTSGGGGGGSAPVAAFSATPVSGDAPLEVIFSDESVNTPTSWLWSFGDGNTSTEQNPTHTYEVAGSYAVSLTVVNANGNDTEIKENYINVTGEVEVPVAAFTASPTAGTPGTEVTFTDLSENNPTSWLWEFGDGSTSTLQNPTRSYEEYGKYTVSLTVSNAAGTDTEIFEELITITETPVAAFSASPTTGDVPLEVHFQDESEWAEEWLWDFGDGTTSEEQNPIHVYSELGFFDVTLTVTNGYNNDSETKNDFINGTDPCPPTVTDVDGNVYNTTLIGEQCWMAENLKVTHYPNGDVIPHVTGGNAWANLDDNNTDDAYLFYDNNTTSEFCAL